MIDFTLDFYSGILSIIRSNFKNQIYKFDEFFSLPSTPERFCIIRHDVDRNHTAAWNMAQMEAEMGVHSSYYFRAFRHGFKDNVIKSINGLNHEVGYHYESLAICKGDPSLAIEDFKKNVNKLNKIAKVRTISMHGSPLSKYNNLDMWKTYEHKIIYDELHILGDVVLDIDYTDIAYITDTGRNWHSQKANLRDKIFSSITTNFNNSNEVLEYLKNKIHNKIILQIHPERWTNNLIGWAIQYTKDQSANIIKRIIGMINEI